ncbi:MAG: type II toxin-antitoxin system VapB family antitoxin [Armatimonadota bacterium]|nr:type II toxin-antitoxin system VapB family antitoxin [Armatimonadota bacterium]MDR7452036.1 type II toxin-antitoxin system VapB family antitoxin [Armatimonadota bacterium]MDR7467927.1 type II toxin-antitoxin system VapB family antitoxin [Armatimonadota bacterium]MDR7494220.1 type II toxin-antitoxin system VapB family antitoxin [Armatimonadota bacterium]MDR7559074.1 type II toxin-antitoxin system VapB family antitoxin [Armatimonadota bacterium]
MRTTLNLDDSLIREAKKRAAREGRTLTSLLEEALRIFLSRRGHRRTYRLQWPVRRGEAPPAVDIADRDALLEAMEGRR